MMKPYLYRSIALHIAVLLIFVFDLPMLHRQTLTLGQAPIIVDLKDVKLGEMTNLPPKAVFGEEEKPATTTEKTPPQYTHEEKEPEPEPEPEPEKVEEPKESFVDTAPEPKPEPKPDPKPQPKQEQPKPSKKPAPKPSKKPKPKPQSKPKPKAENKPQEVKTVSNPLKSLMDSVNSLEKELGEQNAPAVIKTGTQVANMGVEGGTGGSYLSDLSITEIDAIGGRLRECWNLDPGAQGIEGMIIEIRAFLNQDGTVRDVDILDKSRYNNDNHFRSVAESARRAVYTCQPYSILAQKYPQKYDMWKTMLLRFNPISHTVN